MQLKTDYQLASLNSSRPRGKVTAGQQGTDTSDKSGITDYGDDALDTL